MARQILKVAVVRPYLTIAKGGAERYAVELIRALATAGHRVHAFAHVWDNPEQPGVEYTKIPMPRKPAWLRVLRFHVNLRKSLHSGDFDVVLGMTPFWPQQVYWLGDGLYRVWVRIAWPSAPVRRFMTLKRAVMAVNLALERKILSPATLGFVANSELVARQAAELYRVPRERIAVVHPWIDAKRFHPGARARWRGETRRALGIGEGEVAILFASHNFKRKGLDLVLEALARVDGGAQRLRLLVAGAGAVRTFARKAKRLGVLPRTTFLGAVTEMERYYAAADGFVLPTQYDPCAAVCLEAMACGLPVITTAMNGAAELIDEGESGFVLPADASAEMLARCITRMIDPEWSLLAGRRAAERVRPLATAQADRLCAAIEAFARPDNAAVLVRPALDLIVNETFLPLLQRHHLTSFTALLNAAKRNELEYNQNKRIALLTLPADAAAPRFFVKTHRQDRPWLSPAAGVGAGILEWRNILALQRAGIPTAEAVAAGERVISDGSRESFVMTRCLDGYLPADQYIAARFAPPLTSGRRREKKSLIGAIAALAARLHALGFNHRDFYLCHIFVRPAVTGMPELRLIDLQRLGRELFPARRWAIKDLAQLHYSSLDLPLSDRDRWSFFSFYGPPESRPQRRRMLRQVLRKSRSIAKHDAKLRARKPAAARDPFSLAAAVPRDSSRRDDRA